MKKIVLILTILFVSIPMYSQYSPTEPCLPDCEETLWTPALPLAGFNAVITLCDIEIDIKYRIRHACGIWWDYYIEFVGVRNYDENLSACINSYGSMGAFLQAACEQFMILNPSNFPPYPPDSCASNWRILKAGCWAFDQCLCYPGSPGETYYKQWIRPCPSENCCLEEYEICYINGIRTITQTNYLPPIDPECLETAWPMFCKPVCGSIYQY